MRDSGFFDRFRPGSTVHADGNKAWKSEAQRRSIKLASVAHNKMQFTKRHSKTRLTRTQALDKVWSHLKRNVPKSLCSRSKSDRRFDSKEWNSTCTATCGVSTTETGGSSSESCASNDEKKQKKITQEVFFAGSQFPIEKTWELPMILNKPKLLDMHIQWGP